MSAGSGEVEEPPTAIETENERRGTFLEFFIQLLLTGAAVLSFDGGCCKPGAAGCLNLPTRKDNATPFYSRDDISQCFCWICRRSDLAGISSLIALLSGARICCCHPSQHWNICTQTLSAAFSTGLSLLLKCEIQLLSWNKIITAGRCSSQMVVSVCSGPTTTGMDVGNVYRGTHLCTVPCQVQDTDVHISSEAASWNEMNAANQMLCPRISKQSSLVYFQSFGGLPRPWTYI